MFIIKWANYLKTFERIKGNISCSSAPLDSVSLSIVSKKFIAAAMLLQKGIRKDRLKKIAWGKKNEMNDLITSKCWPQGGMKELIQILQR